MRSFYAEKTFDNNFDQKAGLRLGKITFFLGLAPMSGKAKIE